jgi:hypothetical protein
MDRPYAEMGNAGARVLDDLRGDDEEEKDGSGGEAGCPALPDLKPLFGGLDLAGGVGKGLVELEGLGLEGALELSRLERLSLPKLPQEVALELRDLAEKADKALVEPFQRRGDGSRRVAVGYRGFRDALLRAPAIVRSQEGAASGAEESGAVSAGAADRAGACGRGRRVIVGVVHRYT